MTVVVELGVVVVVMVVVLNNVVVVESEYAGLYHENKRHIRDVLAATT